MVIVHNHRLNRNMKKYILLFTSLILFQCNLSFGFEHIGSYTTKPELCPGFDKPYSENIKKIIKRLTWQMTISDDEIIIYMDESSEPLIMKYTIDGRYILGKESVDGLKKYCPFFIEDKNKIHGMNTIFFRKTENKK